MEHIRLIHRRNQGFIDRIKEAYDNWTRANKSKEWGKRAAARVLDDRSYQDIAYERIWRLNDHGLDSEIAFDAYLEAKARDIKISAANFRINRLLRSFRP